MGRDDGFEEVEFFGESAIKDGESAPGFGVDIFIIDVEVWGEAFPFPLVSGPELEEFNDPVSEICMRVIGEFDEGEVIDFDGGSFISDGPSFDEVEDLIWHEVVFILLRLG